MQHTVGGNNSEDTKVLCDWEQGVTPVSADGGPWPT